MQTQLGHIHILRIDITDSKCRLGGRCIVFFCAIAIRTIAAPWEIATTTTLTATRLRIKRMSTRHHHSHLMRHHARILWVVHVRIKVAHWESSSAWRREVRRPHAHLLRRHSPLRWEVSSTVIAVFTAIHGSTSTARLLLLPSVAVITTRAVSSHAVIISPALVQTSSIIFVIGTRSCTSTRLVVVHTFISAIVGFVLVGLV